MIDDKILKRYLAGEGAKEDKELIIDWFSSLSEESSLRKASFPVWDNPEHELFLPEEKAEILLDRINHKIRLSEEPVRREKTTIVRYLRYLSKIAVLLFIPLVIYIWTLRDKIIASDGELVYSEIQCLPGSRTMFNLPDGSRGWLNGGSTLEFPLEFKGKTREIRLSGEAFFEVESNPKIPFIVTGEHIQVKAYGTSFNVTAYPEDELNEVTLVVGSLMVLGIKNEQKQNFGKLDPGQMCSYDLVSSSYQIKTADVEKAISWKSGKLVFRDDSFKEVVKKCNRWYHVNIDLKDKELEKYTYVGTFQDETLDEVLKLLTLTAPIEYKDLGRKRKEDGTFEKRKIELRLKRKR